jgi:TetR/AcrR family transcriptional regulator, regulator of cefoperazone and chloramphenicol sensitivity
MSKVIGKDTGLTDARSKLVLAALHVFAEKGFEGATTREICELANANISAIRYYFGDKAGLYRAAFTEPMGDKPCHFSIEVYANLPLQEALVLFFKEFLEPLSKGEELRLVMKLHFREMLEPTGAWLQEIDAEIKPQHVAMVGMLKQHLGLIRIDNELHRLAFAIIGMGVHFYVGYDVVKALTPQIVETPKALVALANSLAAYSVAMIEAEAKRRTPGGCHATIE